MNPPCIQDIFFQLKKRDFKIALISSGLPAELVNKLGESFGADYAYGIEIYNSANVDIYNTIIKDVKYGIRVFNAEFITISECSIPDVDLSYACIQLYNVDYINITNNYLSGGHNCLVLGGGVTEVVISNNTLVNTANRGIYMHNVLNCILRDNVITAPGFGSYCSQSNYVDFLNNKIYGSDSSACGISLGSGTGGSNNCSIINNSVIINYAHGISLYRSNGNHISGNNATNNFDYGIFLGYSKEKIDKLLEEGKAHMGELSEHLHKRL